MRKYTSAQNAARNAKRQRKYENQCCVRCGYAKPVALVDTDRDLAKSFLEAHHVVGRINDRDATVPLCRNCHAEATEAYAAAGAWMKRQPTLLHKLVMVLRSLGTFMPTMGKSLEEWSDQLEDFINRLTAAYPEWVNLGVIE